MSESDPRDPTPPQTDLDEIEQLEQAFREEEDRELETRRTGVQRQLEIEQERRQKLMRVLDVARSLSHVERVEDLLDRILDAALDISDMDRAFFFQSAQDGTRSVTASRSRDASNVQLQVSVEVSETILEKVLTSGSTEYISDASSDPEFRALRSVRDLSLRTVICVPLTGPSGVMGALYMDSARAAGLLGEEGVRIVEAFAAQAGIALETASHRRDLQEAAVSLEVQNRNLKEALEERTRFDKLIGHSDAMQRVFSIMERVAERPVTVLINGETGTGKDLVARALHFNSPRRASNFISINCAAIPDALLESELFGYRKGAFTGAERDHVGLVETADGGTLFLDEIGDLSLVLQAKLLRVLQESEVRRLGENKDRKVDVRFIAATHRDLAQGVQDRLFREDLYYRLNVITIPLPALRDRKDDVMLLADHFLNEEREKNSRPGLRLSAESRRVLLSYAWPGNVRELQAAMMRAAALAESDIIAPSDLLPSLTPGRTPAAIAGNTLRESLELAERGLVLDALKEAGGNVSQAARDLGVSRQHLHTRIRRLDLKGAY